MPMLQLEKYFYPNISVKANPEFKAEKKGFSGKLSVKANLVSLSKEERRWEVSLTIKTVPENQPIPYRFELETVGVFTVSPNFPEAETEELVRIGGSSLLYSAAREFLLILSSRGPLGAINLPSMSFQKRPKKAKEGEKQPKPKIEKVP